VRVVLAVAIVAGVLGLAGCGGGGKSSSAPPAPASVLPASAPVLVTIGTDLGSSQWQKLFALAHKFPGYADLLAKGRQELAKNGVDFSRDVKPVLGNEAAIAWLDLMSANDFVVALKPNDAAKLEELLKKSPKPVVHRSINGYVVAAPKSSSLDAVSSATAHLSDDPSFKAAIAALPSDDLARAYVNGRQAQAALEKAVASSGTKLPSLGTSLDWIAAGIAPESTGLRLDAAAHLSPAPKIPTYSAELPAKFPAGALLYLSVAHLDGPLHQLLKTIGRSAPSFQQQLSQLETVAGFSIDKDLIPLFAGEAGVAVYPEGQDIPTVVFALTVSDEGKAQRILDRIGQLVQGFAGGKLKPAVIEGVSGGKELTIRGVSLYYAIFGGKVVISNRAKGVSDLTGGINRLADDPVFTSAQQGAKMPDKTSGFLYVNLKDGLPLLLDFLKSRGTAIPSEVTANTAPLQSALLYATQDGDTFRVNGFVGIK